MTGVGSLAAASLLPEVQAGASAAIDVPVEEPLELQSMISRERGNILAAMARDEIPGAAVCLLHQRKPVWVEGLGVTDTQSRGRVGPRTLFSIQSTSKNFTAAAIMIAVQRGVLDLDSRLPIT